MLGPSIFRGLSVDPTVCTVVTLVLFWLRTIVVAPIWFILRLVDIVLLSVIMALSILLLLALNNLMRKDLLVIRLKTA